MQKTAFITGSSRGIGLGIAQSLAKEGWDLAINGVRTESEVEEVINGLRQLGATVMYCQGNISDENDRQAILNRLQNQFQELNLLVNNAGVAPLERKDVLETSLESYERVMNINLKGPFFLTQAITNWMVASKQKNPDFKATIINVSSISATVASINRAEYCISKAGLSMVTQLFAVRLGALDIPVFEVRPGVTATDMTAGVKAKYDELINNGLCVQPRWGQPDDVGKAVACLARGEFAYSTGQVIMIDGGLTISRL